MEHHHFLTSLVPLMQRNSSTFSQKLVFLSITSVLGMAFLAGCNSVPKKDPTPPPDLSAPSDSEAHESTTEQERQPVLLESHTRPSYSVTQVPDHPDAVGRLKVPLGRRWNYVVIHHSSTRSGSEASFDRYHRNKLGWRGVGYHFVIGNGHGSPDGKVEVTFRWEKQLHGAHAGVDLYNQHGIGICLVGDYETSYPTRKQITSLAALVNYLQKRCSIPTASILLHRHVRNTKCPGANFPFYEFISLLEH
jgi:N-acetyl-anhydromuramyl-L-alanine amidase AmpD